MTLDNDPDGLHLFARVLRGKGLGVAEIQDYGLTCTTGDGRCSVTTLVYRYPSSQIYRITMFKILASESFDWDQLVDNPVELSRILFCTDIQLWDFSAEIVVGEDAFVEHAEHVYNEIDKRL